ncbi:phosphotransferase [Akkermansia sp.]|uniref:phosphotransferase n=1 Tax=Akkermansia sp. TaxID=1872421 RepID=UPI0025C6CEB8|nr:phosphotransferase [Akkermansia sp.]MCC8147942.1 phosphotransferase [Akkermansia sp.]
MPDELLFSGIFSRSEREEVFYSFSNADGKRWLMPARHMHTAMQLYQPSGPKGKLLKMLFPRLHYLTPVQRVLHAERLQLALRPQLCELLTGLFPGGPLELSVFCGTPCVHRKFTLQLSRGKRILGYCKVTGSDEIATLFRKEAALLRELAERGMTAAQLPGVLFCGYLDGVPPIFVQSTVKSEHSRVLHDWSDAHDGYLDRLRDCTKQLLPFEETDYAHTLEELEKHLCWVPELPGKDCLTRAIDRVRAAYEGREVEFSAYHADFTPWNMFMEGQQLFVFDWEYAQRTYPHGLDRYHFYTQTATFERRMGAEEILKELPSLPWVERKLYLAYLLDVVSRFTLRERGQVEGDVARSFGVWLKLIEDLSR